MMKNRVYTKIRLVGKTVIQYVMHVMLNNEKFMSKAPESKIAEERAKLTKYTQMRQQVAERLAQLR